MPMRNVYRKFFSSPLPSGERAEVTGPDAQPQSAPLLTRLPPEIRHKIWREVVGDFLFHLTNIPPYKHESLLRARCCQAFSTSSTDTSPRCQGSQKEPCFFSGPAETPLNALSLLLTSRQIYTEALDLLYATNVFNIDALEPLQLFIKWTQQRVQSIQTVHVNIAMWRIRCRDINQQTEVAFAEWSLFWELLARWFTGLKHVRLDIYGTSRAGLGERDLEPLLGLRGLKRFELVLWRDVDGEGASGQDLAISRPLEAYVRRRVCEEG